jgi:hypothetical protein
MDQKLTYYISFQSPLKPLDFSNGDIVALYLRPF